MPTPERRSDSRTVGPARVDRPPAPPSTTTSTPPACQRTTPGATGVTERRGCVGGRRPRTAPRRPRLRRPGAGGPGATRPERRPRARRPAPRPAWRCSSPSGAWAVRSATSSSQPRASAGRLVEQLGHRRSRHAGDEAAGEAPDHDEPGHRDAEEVGRQRRDRDGPEGGQQHRCHPELRGEGDAGGLPEAGGTGEDRCQPRGEHDDGDGGARPRAGTRPNARASGSISTSAVTARPTTRSREIGTPGIASVAASAAIAEARSTDGSKRVITPKSPITTRVAPSRGQRRRRRSSGPASARAKATFCPDTASRCVRPAPSEGVGKVGRLLPVVADDQAREERPCTGVEAARRPSTSVRRSPLATRPAGSPARHASTRSTDSSPEMWRATNHGRSGLDGTHRASHRDDLPGEARSQRVGGGSSSAGPRGVDAPSARRRGRPRSAASGRSGASPLPPRSRLDPVEAVERPLGQSAGEQRHRQPAKHRPAEQRGRGQQRQRRSTANLCAGTSAPADGRRRQRQGPAVAGHTVTRSRRASSLASPMPGTSSSWSIEVKAPTSAAVLDDGRRGRRSDPREGVEQLGVCGVEVHWARRRAGGAGRRAAHRDRRLLLTDCEHVDALPVGHRCGEVDAGGVGTRREPAGGRDGIRDPAAGLQLVEPWCTHRAGHVDHQDLRDRPSWSWWTRRRSCSRTGGPPPVVPEAAAATRTRRPRRRWRARHRRGCAPGSSRWHPPGAPGAHATTGAAWDAQDGGRRRAAPFHRGCRARSLPGRDEAASRGKDAPIVVSDGSGWNRLI